MLCPLVEDVAVARLKLLCDMGNRGTLLWWRDRGKQLQSPKASGSCHFLYVFPSSASCILLLPSKTSLYDSEPVFSPCFVS
jgi:hypothetical protein